MLRSNQIENGHVHLRTHNISTLGTLNFDLLVKIDPEMVDPERASICQGDILFNNTNSQELVGKTSLVDRDYDYSFSNHITRIRLKDGVDPSFVAFYLTLLRNSGHFARICTRWINQAAVNTNALKEQTIPLPLLIEQKQIIAKVNELMALCNRLEAQQKERETRHGALFSAAAARFNEAPTPANLNFLFHESYVIPPADLRKTILNLAVQGKLTPQDPADESVSDLLQRLASERSAVRARIYATIGPDDVPFEIPASWSWVRLGNIALSSDSGWSPQCESEAREGDAWGVLKVSAVSWGKFLPEENKALPSDLNAREECEVKAGDFLLSRANTEDLVARSVVVIDTPPHLMMSDKIVRFTFPDLIDKYFINFVNSANFARAYYSQKASGTSSSMKNVGREVMSNLPVPLPPLVEQRRIVAKTDALFALIDQMEDMIISSLSMADDLLDTIISQLVTAGDK